MVFNNNLLLGAAGQGGDYEIAQSCRFNDADSPELSRTYTLSSPWTFSAWVKRGELASENLILGASAGEIHFNSNDTLEAETTSSTAVFRDSSAWYHIHVSNGGLYVNGVSHGAVTTTTLTNTKLFDDFDGYVAEVHLQAGTSAYTNFGKINADGVWVPISATVGDTYLEFADSANFGVNSGTGGAWTAAGLATTDQMLDTPTVNYATLNPIQEVWGAAVTLSDGNLTIAGTAATVWNNTTATIGGLTSGKWIVAAKINAVGAGNANPFITNETGIKTKPANTLSSANFWTGTIDSASAFYEYDQGSGTSHSFTGGNAAVGDYNLMAVNIDALKVWLGYFDASTTITYWADGATGWTGNPAAGTNQTSTIIGSEFYIGFSTYTGRGGVIDFGQNGLLDNITIPTGFLTLNTANLPEPTIKDGSANFQTTLYTGNGTAIGSGGNAISQSGNSTFQPDFAWIKKRSAATEYVLTDAVRGVTKELSSNDAGAEETVAEGLTTFGSAGFTVGSDGSYNTSSATYAAWQWKANGAGSSNTDGTINTTATSANTTAGFSLVTYVGNGTSGATVGHGLGVVPNMIIVKNRDQADAWQVYHSGNTAAPETEYLVLNTTAATVDNVNRWNDTAPTSSVFSLGNAVEVNTSGENYVAYCFANIEGYSKFGSYAGNSLTDGAFVHLGFRPALLWIRNPTAANYWYLYDTARNPTNVSANILYGFTTDAENIGNAAYNLDIVSNGFKLRNSNAYLNGANMIYMAFAENPFGGENTSPATAR